MHAIQQHLETLDVLLCQEIEAYQQLLFHQREEKRLLVEQSLSSFTANLQHKERLVWQITRLEKERCRVSAAFAPLLGFATETITLKQLSAQVAAPYATKFLQYRSQLQTLLQELQKSNRENALLLQDSLTFIARALDFFARVLPQHVTYRPSGTFTPPTQGRLLSGRI
jgi:flagellar biosynthesis/type III secretory pathway chaperone